MSEGQTLEEIKARQTADPSVKVVIIEDRNAQKFLNSIENYLRTLPESSRMLVQMMYSTHVTVADDGTDAVHRSCVIVSQGISAILPPGVMPGPSKLVQ